MIAQAIGLGAALDYVTGIGRESIARWEQQLLDHATELLSDIPGCRIVGTAPDKAGVLSFVLEDIHPHDIGTILDAEGIAIRAGHHCAQPLMRHFGLAATARASFALYNTKAEVDALAVGLRNVSRMFA
jgi:cysteine desulfurase/selenocysteine lyase